MKKKLGYSSPDVEFILVGGLNLLYDMSADLPDHVEEGDPDTFGDPTTIS